MNKREIEERLRKYNIRNYTINDDLTVDVDGDVYIVDFNICRLTIKFGKVTGYFHYFSQAPSLYNCPYYVGDYADVFSTKLTSLEGCPKYIGGNFFINYDNTFKYTNVSSYTELLFCNIIGRVYMTVKQPDAAYNILKKLGKII
jgi:hypothetical protein